MKAILFGIAGYILGSITSLVLYAIILVGKESEEE